MDYPHVNLCDLTSSCQFFTVTVKVDVAFNHETIDAEASEDRPAKILLSFDVVFFDRKVTGCKSGSMTLDLICIGRTDVLESRTSSQCHRPRFGISSDTVISRRRSRAKNVPPRRRPITTRVEKHVVSGAHER